MKKTLVKLLTIVFVVSIFASCGNSRPADSDNKNLSVEVENTRVEKVSVYFDKSNSMQAYFQDPDAKNIIYAIAGTAQNVFSNAQSTVKSVSSEINESSLVELQNLAISTDEYDYDNVINLVLPNLEQNELSVIITNFAAQLDDYSTLANQISKYLMENNTAASIIGIDLKPSNQWFDRALFAIVLGKPDAISRYMESFKTNTTISKYIENSATGFEVDEVNRINWQIVAANSGIIGIDYDNVEILENGTYPDGEGNKVTETLGSFTEVNDSYKTEDFSGSNIDYSQIDLVEGTVNFTPQKGQFVQFKRAKKTTEERKTDNSENERSTKKNNTELKPRFIGVTSLVDDKKKGLAGKIKIKVPFKLIDGVKLSKINCDGSIKSYIGEDLSQEDLNFRPVGFISKMKNEQGDYVNRIEDGSKSMIYNVLIPNAALYNDKVTKLNIEFSHSKDISSLSKWVVNFDERGLSNLVNFFNALYASINNNSETVNTLTVYVSECRNSSRGR